MMQNKVKWARLGDFIIDCDERNSKGLDLPIIGINRDKDFMPTVANTAELDTTKYKIIREGRFVFSGMQTGRDVCIRLGLYTDKQPSLISPAYTTFTINEAKGLSADFLFMYFYREEMDRYGWFISDSSVRANLDWPRFLDIQIPLPSIEEQRKVVEVWKNLRKVKEDNEKIAEPLFQLCQSYLQDLKHKLPLTEIGPFLSFSKEKNKNQQITLEQGIDINKEFITPQRSNADLSSRVVVRKGQFAYCTQLNNENVAIAYRYGEDCVVSPVYSVFEINQKDKLIPEYLLMWLIRPEFGRFVYWASKGSAYEFLQEENLRSYKIAIPSVDIQQAIVDIYNCAQEAKRISRAADKQSREICPALIQYVINA